MRGSCPGRGDGERPGDGKQYRPEFGLGDADSCLPDPRTDADLGDLAREDVKGESKSLSEDARVEVRRPLTTCGGSGGLRRSRDEAPRGVDSYWKIALSLFLERMAAREDRVDGLNAGAMVTISFAFSPQVWLWKCRPVPRRLLSSGGGRDEYRALELLPADRALSVDLGLGDCECGLARPRRPSPYSGSRRAKPGGSDGLNS